MPLLQASKKAVRADAKRASRNRFFRDKMKDTVKAFMKLVTTGGDAAAQLPALQRAVDMAAKKNIIPANKASRLKASAAKALANGTTVSLDAKKAPAAKKAAAKPTAKKTTAAKKK